MLTLAERCQGLITGERWVASAGHCDAGMLLTVNVDDGESNAPSEAPSNLAMGEPSAPTAGESTMNDENEYVAAAEQAEGVDLRQ